MTPHFFAIPALDPGPAAKALQRFCARHRVASVDRQLVQAGLDSFWAVCVTVVGTAPTAAPGGPPAATGRKSIDYKEVLSPEDFARYAELRALRKTLAQAAGVPIYALFHNAQLAEMVTGRVRTAKDLRALKGVGQGRVDKYGEAFLAVLRGFDALGEE